MTPATNQEPPISDPVVMIGGRTYTVVYDLRAEFKLSEWDLNPSDMMKVLYTFIPSMNPDGTQKIGEDGKPQVIPNARGKWLSDVLNFFAACVARNFINEVAPTGEQWSGRIGPGDLGVIAKALYDALGKWLLERNPKLRPQPAVIPEASSSAPN